MQNIDFFRILTNEIHSVIAATVDENGLPVTCAMDIMDYDENSLYFLTAKGKGFYRRLKQREYIALTGMKGDDTMSRTALSIRGKVKEIGTHRLPLLFEKNSYMREIYPTAESVSALTVFQIYEGSGEWFDLSKKPIERVTFTFGGADEKKAAIISMQNAMAVRRARKYALKAVSTLLVAKQSFGRKTVCNAEIV